MPELATKADAIKIVIQGLQDLVNSSFVDSTDYLFDRIDSEQLHEDEVQSIAEDLGCEVEAILSHLEKQVKQWDVSDPDYI